MLLPICSTNCVTPLLLSLATKISLFPFVYPLALIYPSKKILPSESKVNEFEYSLKDEVPMYFTQFVVTESLSQDRINMSRNPLESVPDYECPVMIKFDPYIFISAA